jgi:hypothetical protein
MTEFHRGADNERGDFDAHVDNAAEEAEAEQRKLAREVNRRTRERLDQFRANCAS